MQKSKQLETILVIVLALGVLFWINQNKYFLFAAFAVGVAGLFIPVAAKAIHWAWMKLAHGLGFISSKVLLSVVFFLILTPLAFFAKRSGKSSVKLKPGGGSYFKDRNHKYTKDDLENAW